ncbi:MAG: FkbM family methyltransferase [Alphaproteobacteria bacterium]|nr:FkbM family methyltransferase [Alphaproteobacteria bacterium]
MSFYRRIPILKRLIPSFLKRMGKLTWCGGYKIVRHKNMNFLLNINNMPDRYVAFHGGYETTQLDYFLSKMNEKKCDLFLDVGANFGLYTTYVACKINPSKIIAFEPDPKNYDQLRATLLVNDLSDAIDTRPLAISDEESTVYFACKHTGVSQIVEDENQGTPIKAVNLDSELDIKNKTVFIKIDIEGHEFKALKGMSKTLQNNKCFLQIESFDDKATEIEKLMKSLNYKKCHQIQSDHYYSNINAI